MVAASLVVTTPQSLWTFQSLDLDEHVCPWTDGDGFGSYNLIGGTSKWVVSISCRFIFMCMSISILYICVSYYTYIYRLFFFCIYAYICNIYIYLYMCNVIYIYTCVWVASHLLHQLGRHPNLSFFTLTLKQCRQWLIWVPAKCTWNGSKHMHCQFLFWTA